MRTTRQQVGSMSTWTVATSAPDECLGTTVNLVADGSQSPLHGRSQEHPSLANQTTNSWTVQASNRGLSPRASKTPREQVLHTEISERAEMTLLKNLKHTPRRGREGPLQISNDDPVEMAFMYRPGPYVDTYEEPARDPDARLAQEMNSEYGSSRQSYSRSPTSSPSNMSPLSRGSPRSRGSPMSRSPTRGTSRSPRPRFVEPRIDSSRKTAMDSSRLWKNRAGRSGRWGVVWDGLWEECSGGHLGNDKPHKGEIVLKRTRSLCICRCVYI